MRRSSATSPPVARDERMDRVKYRIGDVVVEAIKEMLDVDAGKTEWIDQAHSPLGRRRHLELVRTGVLRASRDGRKVLVRRVDIDAYLAKHQVIRVDENADEEREVAKVLSTMGRRNAR